MNDKQFLEWIRDRLLYVHEESPSMDYMHKLQSIIDATPAEQFTPNTSTCKYELTGK